MCPRKLEEERRFLGLPFVVRAPWQRNHQSKRRGKPEGSTGNRSSKVPAPILTAAPPASRRLWSFVHSLRSGRSEEAHRRRRGKIFRRESNRGHCIFPLCVCEKYGVPFSSLSLADIQDRTGIERPNLSRLENEGSSNPTVATLTRYAEALGKRLVIVLVDRLGGTSIDLSPTGLTDSRCSCADPHRRK